MEPMTALTALAARWGAKKLFAVMSGSDEFGDFMGEFVEALSASENQLNLELSHIHRQLDLLLDQRYEVSLRAGGRWLVDAATWQQHEPNRLPDLERARGAFTEALSAAQTPVQAAVAERYRLLTLIALRYHKLAASSLEQLEAYATTGILTSHDIYDRTIAIINTVPDNLKPRERRKRIRALEPVLPPMNDIDYTEIIALSRRLIAEASSLAPVLGLPPRASIDSSVNGLPLLSLIPNQPSRFGALSCTVSDVAISRVTVHDRPMLDVSAKFELDARPALERHVGFHVGTEEADGDIDNMNVIEKGGRCASVSYSGDPISCADSALYVDCRPVVIWKLPLGS